MTELALGFLLALFIGWFVMLFIYLTKLSKVKQFQFAYGCYSFFCAIVMAFYVGMGAEANNISSDHNSAVIPIALAFLAGAGLMGQAIWNWE